VSVCLEDISKYGFHLAAAHERITDLAMHRVPVMGERALVLGGAGASGNVWVIGVIAGLFEAGLDVTQADLIIGTSAGSTAAVQITSATPTQLLAEILSAAPPQRKGPIRADGGPFQLGQQRTIWKS
jgi:NTE family protein